jgi:cell division protein ZapA (FtsZ GTPase activity inhibitor)
LSRDALGVAKQLQQKVSEIRDRTHQTSKLVLDRSTVIPTLNQVAEIVEQQLEDLKEIRHPQH